MAIKNIVILVIFACGYCVDKNKKARNIAFLEWLLLISHMGVLAVEIWWGENMTQSSVILSLYNIF